MTRSPITLAAALTVATLMMVACGPGQEPAASDQPRTGSTESGSGSDSTQAGRSADAALRALESLGYLGSETESEGPSGLLTHDRERAQPGRNFYVSGHASEAVLMDMEGQVLHRWAREFPVTFPDAPPDPEADRRGRHHWRRGYPQPDGDLIAIHEGQGLVRLDRGSEVVWKSTVRAHHAAQVLGNGELWVLSRKLHTAGYRGDKRALAEDFVTVLDANSGQVLRETSVLRAMMRSPFRVLAESSPKVEGDVFHTNSLEVLDGRFAGRHPAFAAGSVLLSSRVLHTVFVLDPRFDAPGEDRGKGLVTWAQQGTWRSQHEPHLLASGDILLFDNSGADPHSRVLEIPIAEAGRATDERVIYAGSDERRFYTKFCGAAARLGNGNTLITETGPGRVFEITAEGEIVWEFVNPAQDDAATDGGPGRRIASIFELVRLPANFGDDWLGR